MWYRTNMVRSLWAYPMKQAPRSLWSYAMDFDPRRLVIMLCKILATFYSRTMNCQCFLALMSLCFFSLRTMNFQCFIMLMSLCFFPFFFFLFFLLPNIVRCLAALVPYLHILFDKLFFSYEDIDFICEDLVSRLISKIQI